MCFHVCGILLFIVFDFLPPLNPTESHWTETLLYKRKEILFTVCPFFFFLFVTKERHGRVWWLRLRHLMEKKRWFHGFRKERRERNVECFLSALSLLPFSFLNFLNFSWEKSCRHFKETTFSSLTCKCSPSSHLCNPRGRLQNEEWGPRCFF